ncbi:hypothetical protein DFA_00603 [Cavenderia fasciculata]|uniref:Uncharacterized protein n=1 Tax=Cavenderia fasciculata TaxID=261658 RepID=F4PSP8_CACFS|nr:uncharacterized protein DFA_00603 [Cavenderia fasciculata]EGG20740.1 hypothetical protein DFA_00603 [Cavenderia fasciculata]|eukprot:XP_004358590.1 hypothetical protein DFA_00603 [Cavenderia fasciculata]
MSTLFKIRHFLFSIASSSSAQTYITFFQAFKHHENAPNMVELELLDGSQFDNGQVIDSLCSFISTNHILRCIYLDQVPIRFANKIFRAVATSRSLVTLDIDFAPIRKPRRSNTIKLLNNMLSVLSLSQSVENITVWSDNLVNISTISDNLNLCAFQLGYHSPQSFSIVRYLDSINPASHDPKDILDRINKMRALAPEDEDCLFSSMDLNKEDIDQVEDEDENSVDSYQSIYDDSSQDELEQNGNENGEEDSDSNNDNDLSF